MSSNLNLIAISNSTESNHIDMSARSFVRYFALVLVLVCVYLITVSSVEAQTHWQNLPHPASVSGNFFAAGIVEFHGRCNSRQHITNVNYGNALISPVWRAVTLTYNVLPFGSVRVSNGTLRITSDRSSRQSRGAYNRHGRYVLQQGITRTVKVKVSWTARHAYRVYSSSSNGWVWRYRNENKSKDFTLGCTAWLAI